MKRRTFLASLAASVAAAASRLPANRNIKWALSAGLWSHYPPLAFTDILDVMRDTGFIGVVRQPRPMWQFSDTPAQVTTRIGSTGEHTREVLREHGLSEAQIDGLVANGVVSEEAP